MFIKLLKMKEMPIDRHTKEPLDPVHAKIYEDMSFPEFLRRTEALSPSDIIQIHPIMKWGYWQVRDDYSWRKMADLVYLMEEGFDVD